MEAVAQCLSIPNWSSLILRRTFPELEQSQIRRFKIKVPKRLYEWSEKTHIATFPNGSTLRFGHCQGKDDVYSYQGDELGFIGFDELTHFESFIWEYLTSRNRSVAGGRPNMAGASNPGSIGHAWCKALWIDKKPYLGMEPSEYYRDDYSFVPALIYDNPVILAKNPEYLENLKRLPYHLRMALLDGSWDVFAGQYFSLFDKTRHTAPPEELGLEFYYQRWVGIDWGFSHECAVYWACQRADGKIIVYREYVVSGKPVEEIAEAIVALTGQENLQAVYLSPDAFDKRSEQRSFAERFAAHFAKYGLPAPTRAVNARVMGWRYLHDLFAQDNTLISRACPGLIDAIPLAMVDPNDTEDVLKQDGDDKIDGWRYTIVSRPRNAEKPYEVRLAERLPNTPDKTGGDFQSYSMAYRRAASDLAREDVKFVSMRRA
jgi:phage terminase large subunit